MFFGKQKKVNQDGEKNEKYANSFGLNNRSQHDCWIESRIIKKILELNVAFAKLSYYSFKGFRRKPHADNQKILINFPR